ncbi:MAG TPA: SusC/RagA family TonB-linked outer membrane protein, partial [Longimicrobiaceae bacterium]|nr:SusC/RagA family TonB-linked outer membrane protein [Longimicrobiaceae bacterium]
MAFCRSFFPALLACLLAAAQLGAQQQGGTITGQVVSATTQAPLQGALVQVSGTELRAATAADGRYTIRNVPPGSHSVTASLIGYDSRSATVTVTAGQQAVADFQLQPSALALEGLTVSIGYGERRAKDVTGSVATVTPDEFNTGRVVSAEQLIQGKVAGVQVVDTGEPGGGINLRVRGGTSVNASSEPLYVIDGVPVPVGGGLSSGRNPLNFLSPQDIESITVLKDASSTAIYGSRGSNGVILIETRSGARGGPQVTYSGSVSTSVVTRRPDLLSADEFRALVAARAPDKLSLLGTADTDWYDAVLRTAGGQEHNASVSGTGGNMNYRLSLGYLGQQGVVQGTEIERVSAGLSYNHVLFDDRLSVRANIRGARSDDQFTPGSVLGDAARFAPTQPVSAGSGFFEWSAYPLGPNNPIAALELAREDGRTYRGIGNIEAQYRFPFLEGLSNTTRLGFDHASSERRTFNPTTQQSQVESGLPGYFSRSTPTETTGVLDSFLTYATRLGRYDSDIDATAGYSYETFSAESPFVEARGLNTDLLGPNGIPTAEEVTPRIDNRESRLASFFARLNYTLLDRYLLTLSVRRDGSSRFGPANQWGTFPAAALGWRVSQEPFMQGVGWLSDLKLRASWGVNGNQAFGDYLWTSSYRPGDALSQVQFGDEFVGTIRPSAVDPTIKWEETTSYNLGLDYGFLADRFTGSLEYYFKDTEDLIFRVPVAAGTNLSNFVTTNIGSVRNRGFEFSLNARVLEGGDGGFSWDANFNAANNHNELLSVNPVGGGSEQILVGGISGGVGSTIQVLQPGYALNSFLVYRHIRQDGRPIYADINGVDADGKLTGRPDGTINEFDLYEDFNGDGTINQADRAPYESPAPDWILGHTSTLSFRNVDLGFTLRAYLGNYVYNNVASNRGNFRELTATGSPENLHASALEYEFASPQ